MKNLNKPIKETTAKNESNEILSSYRYDVVNILLEKYKPYNKNLIQDRTKKEKIEGAIA